MTYTERPRRDVQFAVIIFYMHCGKWRYAAGKGKLRLDLQLNLAESMQAFLGLRPNELACSSTVSHCQVFCTYSPVKAYLLFPQKKGCESASCFALHHSENAYRSPDFGAITPDLH